MKGRAWRGGEMWEERIEWTGRSFFGDEAV